MIFNVRATESKMYILDYFKMSTNKTEFQTQLS